MNIPADRHLIVLNAARIRETGGDRAILQSDGLDFIELGWLTEDYYLTDCEKGSFIQFSQAQADEYARTILATGVRSVFYQP